MPRYQHQSFSRRVGNARQGRASKAPRRSIQKNVSRLSLMNLIPRHIAELTPRSTSAAPSKFKLGTAVGHKSVASLPKASVIVRG
ncbi:hypothetical protein BHE90_016193 [Fusarium euwallaceae]|uniref:Uncharacterized protein n=1 Tax=Fusarium euwallaceae TaxID=1147111 RepID=A0A430L133_9HYPO|nr:hypothetical protein BHE90_016193 [Fusarium euwallaceae]